MEATDQPVKTAPTQKDKTCFADKNVGDRVMLLGYQNSAHP